MRFVLPLLVLVSLGAGCGSGLHSGFAVLSESESDSIGGLPGSPTTPIASSGAGAGSTIVSSANLTVLVRTSSTTISGAAEGGGLRVSDPFFEAGMNQLGGTP